MKIQAADLLFVSNKHGDIDEAIAQSTGQYVHVGIAVNQNQVIHATSKYGVIIQDMTQFMAEQMHVDVYRPLVKDVSGVVERAKKFESQPYNFSFYPDGLGFYCSQLVAVAFKNIISFNEQPMKFGDNEHEVSDFWINYYLKLGVDVPLNQPGTNPSDLAAAEEIEYIGTL